jgi:hypothetical protein
VIIMTITATKNATGAKLPSRLALGAGINVYRNTSVYINVNEVERRLGTFIEVHRAIYY